MKRGLNIVLSALSWLLFALTLIAGFARIIPPRIWAFPQLLCLTLPVISALTLFTGIAWLCFKRRLLPIAAAVVLIAISPSLAETYPVNFPHKPAEDAPTLSLLTYNVHNCWDIDETKHGSARALDYVINSGADIVCFQELYGVQNALKEGVATLEQVKTISRLYPYSTTPGKIDVSLISKYPIKVVGGESFPKKSYFMYEVVEVDIPGHPLTLINVHLTSFGLDAAELQAISDTGDGLDGLSESAASMKNTIYDKLTFAFVQRAEAARLIADVVSGIKGDVILCGDFNDVPASYAYNTIREAGLKDAWLRTRTGPAATFNKYHLYFHIDQVLYRGALRPYEITIGKECNASDHYPLLTRFELL